MHEVGRRYALDEAVVRATKVGGRIDIDVAYLVEDHSLVQTIAESDRVRVDLAEQLAVLGYQRSLSVTFTADRRLTE